MCLKTRALWGTLHIQTTAVSVYNRRNDNISQSCCLFTHKFRFLVPILWSPVFSTMSSGLAVQGRSQSTQQCFSCLSCGSHEGQWSATAALLLVTSWEDGAHPFLWMTKNIHPGLFPAVLSSYGKAIFCKNSKSHLLFFLHWVFFFLEIFWSSAPFLLQSHPFWVSSMLPPLSSCHI